MKLQDVMSNWDSLKIILALERGRTIQGASDLLGMNPTTFSRQLQRATKEFGETLFVRRNREWVATKAGKSLCALAAEIQKDIVATVLEMEASNDSTSNIVLSVPHHLYDLYVQKSLPAFLIENPSVNLQVHHNESSLAFGEANLRIGHNEPEEGRINRSRVGAFSLGIFEPRDRTPRGWLRCCSEDFGALEGLLEVRFSGPARATICCMQQIAELATKGGLACVLPISMGSQFEGLVHSSMLYKPKEIPVWVSYHESQRDDKTLRKFIKSILRQGKSGPDQKIRNTDASAATAAPAAAPPTASATIAKSSIGKSSS